MDVQADDANAELSAHMASVVLGEQADVVTQAIGEALAESGIHSALGQVESAIPSALDQQGSGVRSAPLLGDTPVTPDSSVEAQIHPRVEAATAFPDVNVDAPPEASRE